MGLLKHYIHILSASTLNTILNIFCPTTRDCFTLVLFLADPLPQTAGCKQEYWHRSLAGKSTWRSLHQLAEPWKRQERPQTEHVDHPNSEQYLLIIVTRTSNDASEITLFSLSFCQWHFPCSFCIHFGFPELGLLPGGIQSSRECLQLRMITEERTGFALL